MVSSFTCAQHATRNPECFVCTKQALHEGASTTSTAAAVLPVLSGSGTKVVSGSPPFRAGTSTTTTPLVPETTEPPRSENRPLFESLAQLLERARNLPPVESLIPDFVPAVGSVLVIGPPNSGKTWLMLLIAKLAAEAGREVFVVEEEGSLKAFGSRLEALALPPESRIYIAYQRGVLLSDKPTFRDLLKAVKSAKRPVLLLDPLCSLYVGDENSTEEASAFRHRLEQLQRANPALLLVLLHHTSRHGAKGDGSPLYAGRGSTVFIGWCDVQLNVEGRQAERGKVSFSVLSTKVRDGEKDKRLAVTISLGTGEVALAEESRQPARRREVVAALKATGKPMSKNALATALGGNRQALFLEIDAMEGEEIRRDPDLGGYVLTGGEP